MEHQEYPKLVYLADGSYVKVFSEAEEQAARGPEVVAEVEAPKRRGRPPNDSK